MNLKLAKVYDGLAYRYEAKANPPMMRSHRHRELELNLILGGTVTYVVGGQRRTFVAGSLVWILPMQEHQMVDRSEEATFFVAVFKPDLVREACANSPYEQWSATGGQSDGVWSTQLDFNETDFLTKVLETLLLGGPDSWELNRELGFGEDSTYRYSHREAVSLNAGLRYLLTHCWRSSRWKEMVGGKTVLHPAVSKALERLGQNNLEVKLDELAAQCGLSSAHLSRLFHRQIGVPLNRYRNSVRLSHFLRLRSQRPEKTLLELVYEAGFGSYAQFYKVFAGAYGQGPRQTLRQ